MSTLRLLSSSRRSWTATKSVCARHCLRDYSSSVIQKNENVIVKSTVNSAAEPLFIGTLTPGTKSSHKGREFRFLHDEIIGKEEREFVTNRGRLPVRYQIFRPTFAEYTDHCPRIVTPIYSQDCALIVSLLDLHPTHPGIEAEKLEIFEAGTGNGSLTLHLARAIYAVNTPAPKQVKPWEPEYERWVKEYDEWREGRRAVIHTLDTSSRHSKHAESVVHNFKDGIYAPQIDFHVGEIDQYLGQRLEESGNEPFLERAILDLPRAHHYMEIVGKALKRNGTLILFVPNITQIANAVKLVKELKLPFYLEKTLEIGGTIGVGGREWDVRPVKPRSRLKAEKQLSEDVSPRWEQSTKEAEAVEAPLSQPDLKDDSDHGWEMVCRPKVGLRISGGGFLGVWKKIKKSDESLGDLDVE